MKYNPHDVEEPKIERAGDKAFSKFDWEDNLLGLRTVSPHKPKVDELTEDEDVQKSLKRSKIWRAKRVVSHETIMNSVSHTFSDQQ